MNIQEIADRLHQLVIKGDAETAYDELFSENAIAVEPKFSGFERVEGLNNIRNKTDTMIGVITSVNSRKVSEVTLVGSNHIAMGIDLDATLKDGNKMSFSELAVYEVEDGKIVSEQFFY